MKIMMGNDTNISKTVGSELSVDEWNQELATELIADTVCLVVYLITGVFGNSVVLYVYAARKRLNNEDRFFIPILAIIDLIACMVNCSFSISINMLPVKYDSDIACKFIWFLAMYVTAISAFTLMLIAINRYLKLCKRFGRQMTHKWKKYFLVIILISAAVLSLPSFAFYGSAEINSGSENLNGRRCTSVTAGQPKVAFAYKILLFVVMFGILVVLVVLYSLIGRVLFRQARFSCKLNLTPEAAPATSDSGIFESDDTHHRTKSAKSSEDQLASGDDSKFDSRFQHRKFSAIFQHRKSDASVHHRQSNAAEMRLLKHRSPGYRVTVMFMIIAVVYVVCFIPKLAMMIWESTKTDFWLTLTPSELGGYRFLYTVFIINHIVNPFIYGFMDRKFRTEFRKVFCRKK